MDENMQTYEKLSDRISEIIKEFSFEQDPVIPPTPVEEDKIRAMIVLCHAEFEAYIENLACDLLDEGEKLWDEEKTGNRNLTALFINSEKMKTDPSLPNMTVYTYSKKIIKEFRNKIEYENHGIKRNNIESIYCPLGYQIDEIDQDFLSELDTFGSTRGRIAHTSNSQARNMLDLKTETEKIKKILLDIKSFSEFVKNN